MIWSSNLSEGSFPGKDLRQRAALSEQLFVGEECISAKRKEPTAMVGSQIHFGKSDLGK